MRNTTILIAELKIRRDNLTNRMVDNSVAIFLSNTTQFRNADVEYPFRQDSNFWYLTGIDDADCILVLKKVRGEVTTSLYIPKFDSQKALWTGQDLTNQKATVESGISEIKFTEDFENDLISICSSVNVVYFDEGFENWSEMRHAVSKFINGQSRRSITENITTIHKTSVLINDLRL
jgi:Xaa-Pro aminopeptidase